MRRRLMIMAALFAAVFALAAPPARASATFIVFLQVGERAVTAVGSAEEARRVEIVVRAP